MVTLDENDVSLEERVESGVYGLVESDEKGVDGDWSARERGW